MTDKNLAEILSKNKTFSNSEIEIFQNAATKTEKPLYDYLITEKISTKNDLGQAIASAYGVKHIDLTSIAISADAAQSMPELSADKNNAIIFKKDAEGIHLATSDPGNETFIKNFAKRAETPVIVYFADDADIKNALGSHHAASKIQLEDLGKIIEKITNESIKTIRAEDLPIIKIVQDLLELGYKNKSSDIHIEPYENDNLVRFRIDGIMHDVTRMPKQLQELITTRIKILARLRTDEHQAAQDGRLKFKSEGKDIDVRVSIVPVIYGEKIVMRILSEKARQFDLENLGFSEADFKKIKNNIAKPWGLLLVTGPTGCGKTTTLYSVLKILNTREVNISTIEDPVEYDIEGINQIQVNPKTNLTFAKGLRAIVRQDPDIIMVGEIRDPETASIAINSALTGHLVLSTLHTNDSATTLPRLLDMGVKSFLVASTINIAIAQRLVRKICPKCKYEKPIDTVAETLMNKVLSKELIKKHGLDDKNLKLFAGHGCAECQFTGYTSRVGIFEIMEMSEEIKKLVMDKANASAIRDKAIEQGMTSMVEDGLVKMKNGITTIDEILRVTRE